METLRLKNSLSEKAAESAPPSRGRILLAEPESIRQCFKSKSSEICDRCRLVSVRKRPDNSEVHQEPSVNHRTDGVLVIKLEIGNCQVSPVAQESIGGAGVITQPP